MHHPPLVAVFRASSRRYTALPSTVRNHHSRLPTVTRSYTTTPALKMRIPYTPDPPTTTDASDLEVIERVKARRAPRPLQPLDLALLHSPPVADGWNAFLGAVRTKTSISDAVREVAISRVAVCNRAWYEWGHHAPLAVQAGVSEAAMELVKAEDLASVTAEQRARAGLGEKEWSVLRLTDEMTRNVSVRDKTFDELKRHFDEREVVELVATVSCYNCVSRFLVALDGKWVLFSPCGSPVFGPQGSGLRGTTSHADIYYSW